MSALDKAQKFIAEQEGCKLKSYQDQGGIWTVGYGSTGSFITGQTTWTQAQADADLAQRIEALYSAIRRHIIPALSENQWAALISLAYNIGITNLFGSTLIKCLNERDLQAAAAEFPKWDKVRIKGVLTPNPGLHARRLREQVLFETA